MNLGRIMEHIEEAGIHSGDSARVLPPITLGTTSWNGSAPPPSPSPKASGSAA